MIYIFNAFAYVCSLPGTLCKEFAKLCGQLNCNLCQDCCRACSRCLSEAMAKPLSTYVIFAFLISGFELYLCYHAFKNTACVVDMPLTQKASVDFTTWVIIQGGFGLLNLLFAPYFQRKIWQHLKKELESPESDTSETDTHADGYVVVPKKDVQAAFKHTFLYDVGVLIYFFACVASFVWGCIGLTWMAATGECHIELLGAGGWAAYCGNTLCGVALLYLFAWYCCECCARSVKVQRDPMKDFLAGKKHTEVWEGNV